MDKFQFLLQFYTRHEQTSAFSLYLYLCSLNYFSYGVQWEQQKVEKIEKSALNEILPHQPTQERLIERTTALKLDRHMFGNASMLERYFSSNLVSIFFG